MNLGPITSRATARHAYVDRVATVKAIEAHSVEKKDMEVKVAETKVTISKEAQKLYEQDLANSKEKRFIEAYQSGSATSPTLL